MAELPVSARVGTSFTFNETTKQLTIDLNDLTDAGDFTTGYGLDVSAMTNANIDQYSSRILWALLLLSQQNQAADNNDETVGLYITNQGKRNVIRNGVAQFGFQLVATAYQNDTVGVVLDPDNIAA